MSREAVVGRLAQSPGEFRSVLFGDRAGLPDHVPEPGFFRDLNLDQVVEAIVAGRDEYDLKPFFHAPLRNVDLVAYRHEVFRDLEDGDLRAAVEAFASEMRRVRQFLNMVETQRFERERERWLLDAAVVYHQAVAVLSDRLGGLELRSRALRGVRSFLAGYTGSEGFTSLVSGTGSVLAGLDRVAYAIRINGARVTVSRYRNEPDYSGEVEEAFERFRQGDPEDHLVKIPDSGAMDHVEARIVELVARLYPEEFAALDEFCARHRGFLDELVARFDRKVQFYLAFVEFWERLEATGVAFSYPTVSTRSKETAVEGGVDVALATKLQGDGRAPVPNDFCLRDEERILVVSGPNQGGKTTFARMFGQLHYFAGLGVPVAARSARVFLPDRVFTHFERREEVASLHGKLDDELLRVKEILEEATEDSVCVLNEIFASTTLGDAVLLGTDVVRQILGLGCLGVCVTFVDELASLGPATVSMVATVFPADPSRRTFHVVRRPADGRAYAWSLAAKYGLSYDRLKERLVS